MITPPKSTTLHLTGKSILMISPQRWDTVRVSKHHYAITLASLGNIVYFLNPPDPAVNGVNVSPSDVPGVYLVSYHPFFPIGLRFRFKRVFRMLMSVQIKRILRAINSRLDIVWCFDPNLYHNLSLFRTQVRIFHPVDVFTHNDALRVARSAQVLFSVSPTILEFFKTVGRPAYFINHGLGESFCRLAASEDQHINQGKNICYIGNLLIPYLDRDLLRFLIRSFPDKIFHFIGPYTTSSLGSGDKESEEFIGYLEASSNVTLYGPKSSSEMSDIMTSMDAFILCYTGSKKGYDLSNSHKILEYLSTGKPVISTPIIAYRDQAELISMPTGLQESEYPAFFKEKLSMVEELSIGTLSKKRKALALENSYLKQIARIDEILARLNLI